MDIRNYLKIAEESFKMITLVLKNGEQRCNNKKIIKQAWNFSSQISNPIISFARDLKNVIYQLEKQSFAQVQPTNYVKNCKETKQVENLNLTKVGELQKELQKTSQLMQEYKFKAENYYNHWIYELQQISEKNLEVATLKSDKDKLNKQITLNFQLYKKQVELNSQLSKQCSLNYAAYLKESEARKAQSKDLKQKQEEREKITELKSQIDALHKKVNQLSQKSNHIYEAYKELQDQNVELSKQNKTLKEELVGLKQQIQDLVFLLKGQLEKENKCTCMQQPSELPAVLITDAVAQLYSKLTVAQAKIKVSSAEGRKKNVFENILQKTDNARTSKKICSNFQENQASNNTLEMVQESQDVDLLKKQIQIMSNNYAQMYLKHKHKSYYSKFEKSSIIETPKNMNKADIFQTSKESSRRKLNSSFYENKKKTEETNITNISNKSAKNQYREELQFSKQKYIDNETQNISVIRWKFNSKESWMNILQKTAELISHQICPNSILQVSTLLSYIDRSVMTKLYYNTKLGKKAYQVSKITFSLIRTKANVQAYQKFGQVTEHQKQVNDELFWLSKRRAKIVSINDLEIAADYDQNLTVIWYYKARS